MVEPTITDESIKAAVTFMVANPDRVSAEMKTALASLTGQNKQAEPVIEMTDTSKGIASSTARLQAELEDAKKALKEQKDAANMILSSALKAQEAQYLNEIESQKERQQIISSLYKVMPRHQVDKMVADKVTTDTLKSMNEMITSSGQNLVGVARGLEIRSAQANLKDQITKLGYSEITFDKGMVD